MILHTTDVGETWEPQVSHTTLDLHGVLALSEDEAYVVGDGGTVLHTSDGGETWVHQDSPVDTPLLGIALAEDESTVWALGAWGVVLRAPRPAQPVTVAPAE